MTEQFVGLTFGKYRIDALIGSGGFAWVYRAYDPELDIVVAIKVLKPQYAGDVSVATRFRREASTAARLRHPNIINVLAVGNDQGTSYLAMDYLADSLAARLESGQPMQETAVLRVGLDVARALAFAHRQGVIHRDVKVDNILFDDHGNAIVADFGIARAMQQYTGQTGVNMVMGTPEYFSPEQARGRAVDGRSDIYALGVTLFRAATGCLPFEGGDWYDVARHHVDQPPPLPRSINPDISPAFEAIILKCLEKDPENRFATLDELADELEGVLQGRKSSRETSVVRVTTPLLSSTVTRESTVRHDRAMAIERRAIAIGAPIAIGVALLLRFVVYPQQNPVDPGSPAMWVGPTRSAQPGRVTTPPSSTTVAVPRATISVTAPPSVAIFLDGIAIGVGAWQADTMPVGRPYLLTASVQSFPGCRTATDSVRITTDARVPQRRELHPLACGAVTIAPTAGAGGKALPASFSITAPSDTARGQTPMTAPAILPMGEYQLHVESAGCKSWDGVISVDAGQARIRSLPLICGT